MVLQTMFKIVSTLLVAGIASMLALFVSSLCAFAVCGTPGFMRFAWYWGEDITFPLAWLLAGIVTTILGGRWLPWTCPRAAAILSILVLWGFAWVFKEDWLEGVTAILACSISGLLTGLFLFRSPRKRKAPAEEEGPPPPLTGEVVSPRNKACAAFLSFCFLALPYGYLIHDKLNYQGFDSDLIAQEGEVYVERILEFTLEHGRTPNSLKEIGLGSWTDTYGPWSYRNHGRRFSAHLQVGDYGKRGWAMGWKMSVTWDDPVEELPAAQKEEAADLYLHCLRYLIEHGSFPTTMDQLGLSEDWSSFGPWTFVNPPPSPWKVSLRFSIQAAPDNSNGEAQTILKAIYGNWWTDT